jgi:hypothetical protein
MKKLAEPITATLFAPKRRRPTIRSNAVVAGLVAREIASGR